MVPIQHLLILVLLMACSHQGKKGHLEVKAGKRPVWVNEPGHYCRQEFICATGSASSKMLAQAKAREELAKFFQVRIESKMTHQVVHDGQDLEQAAKTNTVQETYDLEFQEKVDSLLEGVEVPANYQDGEGYYALARLRKKAIASLLKSRLENFDQSVKALYLRGSRLGLNRALRIWEKRQSVDEKFQLVRGIGFPAEINREKILKKRAQVMAIPFSLHLEFKELKTQGKWKRFIAKVLGQNGFQISNDTKKNYHKVKGSFLVYPLHLNVKGFKRFRFSLALKAISPKGLILGSISHNEIAMGRNMIDAYERSRASFESFIEENIDQINLE